MLLVSCPLCVTAKPSFAHYYIYFTAVINACLYVCAAARQLQQHGVAACLGPQALGEPGKAPPAVSERAPCLQRAGGRSTHLRRPSRGADEAAGDLDESGLAGAVRAEQADELSLADLEVDSGQRGDGSVALLQSPDGESGGHPAEFMQEAHERTGASRPATPVGPTLRSGSMRPDPVASATRKTKSAPASCACAIAARMTAVA